MRNFACAALNLTSKLAWLGVLVSFVIYNFYVQARSISEPPCDAHQVLILWRSAHYCATTTEAQLWELNYRVGSVLMVTAAVLTVLAGVCRKYFGRESKTS